MKTTITTTIDTELKKKVMPIIQNKMKTSLAKVVSDRLVEILRQNSKEVSQAV